MPNLAGHPVPLHDSVKPDAWKGKEVGWIIRSVSINLISHQSEVPPKRPIFLQYPRGHFDWRCRRSYLWVSARRVSVCPPASRTFIISRLPQSCLQSRSVEGVLAGGNGLGGGAGLGLRGLPEPPPSLSVFVMDAEGGGGRRGREDVAEASWPIREHADVERRLWIRRHSWHTRTCVQPRGAGAGIEAGTREGAALEMLAPRGSSSSRWGPGPISAGTPGTVAAPVNAPVPLYSLPLLRRISRTRRTGLGAPRGRRAGWRRMPWDESGRRRRKREFFLHEITFRNSVIISWHTDTWERK